MDEDQELLQDFLVEAGEILEQLGEQLVDLENRPQDSALLNAVFRGFHTIKGGASFLSLDALVQVCHRAEDVFNVLRNGQRSVNAQVMDVILPVLDMVNSQFDAFRGGETPEHADAELLQKLEELSVPESESAQEQADEPQAAEQNTQAVNDGASDQNESGFISDDEFQHLMDTLEGKEGDSTSDTAQAGGDPFADASEGVASDDITEEEFESLLDQLQGVRSGTVNAKSQGGKQQSASGSSPSQAPGLDEIINSDKEEISEDEFDALLDHLHGQGAQKPAVTSAAAPKPAQSPPQAAQTQKPGNTNKAAAAVNSKEETAPAKAAAPVAAKPKDSPQVPAHQAETTVRVDTKRLDDIMNMVGELVLVRNRIATLDAVHKDEEMSKVVANLDVVTADLQATVMKTRMQPIKKVFGRFPRVVRDLARSLKKEVTLELQGEDTDLDKNLVEALADPLVHLVRNAVDHGIESPDERVAKGKPKAGTVVLSAEQEGDHILLTIEDDGKGMDPEKLRQSAIDKGMLDKEAASRLEDKDCYNLIFQPGFSTKEEISDVSGRGVGMDVVKTRIEQLNGSVEIDSTFGKGSIIVIKVPLTLAIMPTLMVMLERQIFALPLANVNEIFHLNLTKTNVVDGQLVVMVRDKALPLFYLRHWLVKGAYTDELPSEGHVVVVSMGAQRIGFVVDHLIGQEEVVIKPLGALLHGMKGLAGATITGDGRISLILDIPGLMQRYARRF